MNVSCSMAAAIRDHRNFDSTVLESGLRGGMLMIDNPEDFHMHGCTTATSLLVLVFLFVPVIISLTQRCVSRFERCCRGWPTSTYRAVVAGRLHALGPMAVEQSHCGRG